MKHFINTLLYPLVIAVMATSCYNDNKENLYKNFVADTNSTGCDTATITFTQVKSIFITNCALSGCHKGSNPQSGLDLSMYPDAERIARDGRLEERITDNPGPVMPPTGKLPQNEIDILLTWASNPCPE